ncbi:MAG TPA: glutamine--fructose-6-phosphate transaminase (isomerizing) [Methanoculleus sp.]|nr:glutamine--fructose-6-phosphate transaminase (isomerizing) [Methanoculleus sp.]
MCGIVGYIGIREAAPVIVEGLKRLEYRGYDSFGIATLNRTLSTMKKCGRISENEHCAVDLCGKIGIGHTRWATHGKPDDLNAHPHTDCTGSIAVVHNGIIENYAELKRALRERGHVFSSETDTEVIAHLIEEHYAGDLFDAVRAALAHLEGSYAVLALAKDDPRIIAARNASPLVIGIGDGELLAASDVTPLLDHTRQVIFLEDGDTATITPGQVTIWNGSGPVERPVSMVEWDVESAKKGGFEHFMIKEIYEQPDVFFDTASSIKDGEIIDALRECGGMTLVSCGTSYHAALIFRYLAEKICSIPVRVELASEFKYYAPPLRGMVVGVTQSGETADTIAALKKARQFNCTTLGITNVLDSSVTRIADHTMYTRAGPEISVAATKSFIAQLAVFLQIINLLQENRYEEEMAMVHRQIEDCLLLDLVEAVEICGRADHVFFVGRGPYYPVALEGALKLKEISYIHAEGYAAGELKHGPFALLSEKTPVIALCLPGESYAVMLSNIKEMKARSAPIIAIGVEGDRELGEIVDILIGLPKCRLFGGILMSSVVLQLLAYHTARMLGRDIDKPRNLAKSVTVE